MGDLEFEREQKGGYSLKNAMDKGYVVNRLLVGTGNVTLGVLLFTCQELMRASVLYLLSALLLLKGLGNIIGWITQKPRKIQKFVLTLVALLFGVAFLLYPLLPFTVLTLLFGCYLLLYGVIKGLDAFLLFREGLLEGWLSAASAVFYLIFGLILTLTPGSHISVTLYSIGTYCVLLGITYLADGIRGIVPDRTKGKIRRRIRVTLPIFLVMFIPY